MTQILRQRLDLFFHTTCKEITQPHRPESMSPKKRIDSDGLCKHGLGHAVNKKLKMPLINIMNYDVHIYVVDFSICCTILQCLCFSYHIKLCYCANKGWLASLPPRRFPESGVRTGNACKNILIVKFSESD